MHKALTHKRLAICLLICILSFYSCTNDDDNSSRLTVEYFEALDVSYGNDSDQIFDIYLPANRTFDTRVIILVHGGGWTDGDKSDMNGIKDFILQDIPNVAVVNIKYRLADENNLPYPMQIEDINAVVDYLKDNQLNFIISDEIGFVGISAGAHLSMLYSYAFDTENKVKMVANIVGPTNFTDPAYLNAENIQLLEAIEMFGVDNSVSYLEEISPYHQVMATAPPTIMFYGGQDPLIPITQALVMDEKLTNLGVTHQLVFYPNVGHGWVEDPELSDTYTKLKSFIEMHLQ